MSEVQERCHYVARAQGGHGVVREILELILKSQGKWAQAVTSMVLLPPKAGGKP